ncbi:hypothetical protein HMPREF0731_0812 [Pseudoroseomonas cervicalis ATCC 49957]|uniref:Uncharacterized protein n=1 Tax=Pseudoroseomonas cervicalis ATCC 49957 TaxID=525371 RepID=D5RIA2_9PROT|nr:hypothetical protein HMPREF0731_0812 [Pseudoroseomonas cervicalis ATCC 49957]
MAQMAVRHYHHDAMEVVGICIQLGREAPQAVLSCLNFYAHEAASKHR